MKPHSDHTPNAWSTAVTPAPQHPPHSPRETTVNAPGAGLPRYPDFAEDLLDRAAFVETYWRMPGHLRAGMAGSAHASVQLLVREHAVGLRRIIESLQVWPGRGLVGDEACQAAVTIAVHSDHDPPLQRLSLRLLRTAVEQGEATAAQFAHLQDRFLLNALESQRYGTQFWYDPDSGLKPFLIGDPEGLDARRAEVGLRPHAEAFQRLRQYHEAPEPLPAPVPAYADGVAA
ncbi:DUF6624 domain-containing protein [Streptomyces niveus]|uniref:DUF6624 domain-containing protein n=1 Tax=Streptomyces niveus TaxID=193462 RepID=UPI003676C4E2